MPRSLMVLCLVCSSVGPARAQPNEPASQPATPPNGSYLNSSFEATEALARAKKLIDAQQWATAVTALQTTAEKFGDFLIPIDAQRHTSIRDYVNQQVANVSPDGLAAYRANYEVTARIALKSAMNESGELALIRLADRYFATQAAALALDEAGERAIERGAFKSARRWYAKLATSHPDRNTRPEDAPSTRAPRGRAWHAKAALCDAFDGDESPLRVLIGALEDHGGDGTVPWGGREQPLVEFLRAELMRILAERGNARDADLVSREAINGTTILGNTPDRRGFAKSAAVAEARLWRFVSFGRAWWEDELTGYESQSARKDAWLRMLQSGRMLANVPVVGSPTANSLDPPWVFVHDARTVWAIDPLHTDRPAWRYEHPGSPDSRPSWNAEDEPPLQFTSLLNNGRLYVHLDAEQPVTASGQTLVSSILLCLDAGTGAVRWQNKLENFTTAFEDTRLDGAPLLHDGALYAQVRRRKPFGFEACYLVRCNVETGAIDWFVHLGEAATGSYGYHRPTVSHAAASGDLIFVQTNLGTIAAVSSGTGRVVWLSQYESKFSDAPEGFWPSRMGRPTRAWQYPAMLAWRDAVVAMPLDTDTLLVLNSTDGRELFRASMESLDNPEQIIGARGDLIYLVGSQLICYDLSVRSRVWQRPIEHGQLFGRAVLTTNGIFVPTNRELLRYPLEGGPATAFRWSLEDSGNLAASADQIVVASATSVFGVAGKEAAFAQLDQRLKDSAEDTALPLALAELAFNTGEDQRGIAAVEEAIRRAGGFARLTDDALRRRLFASLMQFTRQVMAPDGDTTGSAPPQPRTESALKLLGWAAQCAPDTPGQALYRLQLANVYLARREFIAATRTYQQILSDRGLRATRLRLDATLVPSGFRQSQDSVEDDSDQELGDAIPRWIAWLIGAHGADVYADIESSAQDRLTVARSARDAAALLEVADSFPNSKAAPIALADHARAMIARGDHDSAIRSFRRALSGAPSRENPDLIREFADCLAKNGKWASASQWLARGRRDFPSHRFTHEGKRIDFDAYRRLLIGDRDTSDPACATAAWPVKDAYKRLYPERISILDPAHPQSDQTKWDALVTYCGGQIEARNPATCSALWSRPVPCESQPQLLGMDDARFFFATTHRLFALTRTSGQQAWSIGDDPPDDPDEDPESHDSWTCHYLGPARLVSSSDRGELVCIDTTSGNTLWRKQADAHTNNQIVANDRVVCYATWQGRQHALVMLDAVTGKTLADAKPEEDWPVLGLAMTHEGSLIVLFSNAIHALDPTTGKSRWRAATTDRFVPATMFTDDEGLFISADGRRLTKYDSLTGRLCWTTTPISNAAADALWVQPSEGVLYAACGEQLGAYDMADGRTLWNVRIPLRADTPRLTKDSILVVQTERRVGEKKDSGKAEPPKIYRLIRFRRDNGERADITDNGDLITSAFASFGGLYARDRSLILLDGNQLLGYASAKAP
ncbi:MAG: PQQ-binding-like beta-propeller repeat protein [Planctomycetes bacterium]|nr:PQQ-binding-like beta-propeller repeat protein [Planctomycetota bacterium]